MECAISYICYRVGSVDNGQFSAEKECAVSYACYGVSNSIVGNCFRNRYPTSGFVRAFSYLGCFFTFIQVVVNAINLDFSHIGRC